MVGIEVEWTKILFLSSLVCYALWMDCILGETEWAVYVVARDQKDDHTGVILILLVPVDFLVFQFCIVETVHTTLWIFLYSFSGVFHPKRGRGKFLPVFRSALVEAKDLFRLDSIFCVEHVSYQLHILGVVLYLFIKVALYGEGKFKADVV